MPHHFRIKLPWSKGRHIATPLSGLGDERTLVTAAIRDGQFNTESATRFINGDKMNNRQIGQIIQTCTWAYTNVPEVWNGIQTLAETTMRATVIDTDRVTERIAAFNRKISVDTTEKLLMVNALTYGQSVSEPAETYWKVRDPLDFRWKQDNRGRVSVLQQRTNLLDFGGARPVNPDIVKFFTLHPRWSDDLRGVPAPQPSLYYILLLQRITTAAYRNFELHGEPILWVTVPLDFTIAEMQYVRKQLESPRDYANLVLPPGCVVTIVGGGKDQYNYDKLVDMVTEKIATGLRIPRQVFGLGSGSNKATAQVDRDLLFDRCIPLSMSLADHMNTVYEDLFGVADLFSTNELNATEEMRRAEEGHKSALAVSKLLNARRSITDDPPMLAAINKKIFQLLA